ncbi:MAG: S8 family serine peptidase, partial [Planctomycetales bacterium]|nr:S8 family serine peptidase [Planctomycetales bacterium]
MNRTTNNAVAGLAVAAFAFSALAANANEIPQFIKPVPKPIQLEGTQAGSRLVQATALIRAAEARTTYQVDGAGLAAAVLDTGLRTTHVDFAGRVIAQRNFTSNNGGNANNATDGDGHGTNVCGVIMAHGNHTGIASGANIVPVKVLDNNGSGSFADIEAGIDWVIANRVALNITVVNLSLGDSSNGTSVGNSSFRTKIQQLRTARVAVVIAAGNDFFENNSQQGMSFPGIIPECV